MLYSMGNLINKSNNSIQYLGFYQMKLVAKVSTSQETLDIPGFKTKKIKNGFIFDVTYKINENIQLPKELFDHNDVVFLINIAEKGGTCDGKVYAQIVTGASSKPLRPFFIPRKHITSCGEHAFFSVPEKCYSIETFDGETIKIKENTTVIDKQNLSARLNSIEVYSGEIENLPEEHIRFKKASEICLDKAGCEDCQFIYYFVDPSNRRILQDAA